MKSICFYLFLILGLTSITSSAQDHQQYFRNLQTKSGLSHNKVNCIIQDKRGFLWFGTEDGLNRFDGDHFTVFKSQPHRASSISGSIITDLHEDKDGIIWIATSDGGLTRYNYRLPAAEQFRQFKYNLHLSSQGTPENSLSKITEDGSGNLWLTTNSNYILRFNKQTKKFDTPVKNHLKNTLTLTMIGKDTLWAAKENGGFLKINTRTLKYKTDQCCLVAKDNKTAVTAVFKANDQTLWFGGTDKSIYHYKPATQQKSVYKPFTHPFNIQRGEIKSFTEDKQKNLWIVQKNMGVIVYNQDSTKFTTYRHDRNMDGSLIDDHVNVVYTDRSGIVWIGTDHGISILDPVYSPFMQFDLPKTGKDITVYDFYKDEQDKLWIATSEGIFTQKKGSRKFDYRKLVYQGQQLSVTKFFVDKDKTFYIGTDYTLFKYNTETNQVQLLPNTATDPVMKKLVNSRIVSIVRDTVDKHPVLVVSPYGHYMTYYDLVDKKWVPAFDPVKNKERKLNSMDNMIKKLYKDSKGGLWLASNKLGLGDRGYNAQSVKYFTNDMSNNSSISSNDVYDIQEDKKGNLWISTYGGGLNYLNIPSGKFSHIKGSSNLTEGLQTDLRGHVWTICNGHMHEYNPFSRIYSCYDLPILQKNGGVEGYIYKDRHDFLYAGGVNFFMRFDPKAVSKIVNDPDVYFTDFKIFNTSYSQLLENKVIHLDHEQNYFSIEFSAPEYSSNHIHYDYQLAGVDKEWVDGDKRNFASYSNLPGGKYLFKVRACNWKGNKVNKFTTITIIIYPPFWKKWWFYLLVFILIALPCYLFYRYRITEFLKRQSIRNGIAQDLHDHIGSTLSSISIYTQVAKIYQEQQQEEKLRELLLIIGQTANDTISEMSDIVWAINPKNDHMEGIMQKIQSYAYPLCAARNILFNFNCDSKVLKLTLEMIARKNFFLILKELTNNAIKHSECKNLSVSIRQKGQRIELIIEDDGKGFDPDFRSTGTSPGNGMGNIKSRAAELKAQLTIESKIQKGTKVTLLFNI